MPCITDVHVVLADLATEQESFEDALSDYKEAERLSAPNLKVPTLEQRLRQLAVMLQSSFETNLNL